MKREWTEKNNKLHDLKHATKLLKETFTTRKDNTVINRLTAGHTLLYKMYLMEGHSVPPCELYQNDTRTVKHLL